MQIAHREERDRIQYCRIIFRQMKPNGLKRKSAAREDNQSSEKERKLKETEKDKE
jgi:hypothetical protein